MKIWTRVRCRCIHPFPTHCVYVYSQTVKTAQFTKSANMLDNFVNGAITHVSYEIFTLECSYSYILHYVEYHTKFHFLRLPKSSPRRLTKWLINCCPYFLISESQMLCNGITTFSQVRISGGFGGKMKGCISTGIYTLAKPERRWDVAAVVPIRMCSN